MTSKLATGYYKEDFKRKVIEEYLSTGCTKASLLRKYKIPFVSAIQHWMKVLGYKDHPKEVEMLKFMQPIFSTLSDKKDLSITEMQQRIRELERQLQEEKLRSEAYARVIEKAESELKIPIRKKPNTK